MIPSAASSRSALRDTMAGFLPPISTIVGRGHVRQNEWNSRIPTSYEPVKTMPSMPGVVLERLPDRLAGAHDEVDDAGRHAGVDVAPR